MSLTLAMVPHMPGRQAPRQRREKGAALPAIPLVLLDGPLTEKLQMHRFRLAPIRCAPAGARSILAWFRGLRAARGAAPSLRSGQALHPRL
jgi:hypothetical protein